MTRLLVAFRNFANAPKRVKVKFTLEQAMKTQRRSRGIASLFLQPRRYVDVGGERHAPVATPPGKTLYPF